MVILWVPLSFLNIPLSRLVFPAKSWPDILLTYNREAVEAAKKAGIELLLPEEPIPEKRPLTEEEFTKVELEVSRLKEIISVLSWLMYVSIKLLMLFIFFGYLAKFDYSGFPYIFSVIGTIGILFGVPIGIFVLIGRWARLDSYRN
jgi:hypothetical protein